MATTPAPVPSQQTAKVTAITLMAMVLSGAVTHMLTPDQYDKAYYCGTSDEIWVFARLSSTAKTGYYNSTSGVEVGVVCKNATWEKLSAYCKRTGLDCGIFLAEKTQPSPNPQPYSWNCQIENGTSTCQPQKCEVK